MVETREIYNLILQSILKLQELKILIRAYSPLNDCSRIRNSIAGIDRVIQHGNYYIHDVLSFDANEFRFDYEIVSLVDTIRDNDYGIPLTENDKRRKAILCDELITLVEQLIVVNNKFKND